MISLIDRLHYVENVIKFQVAKCSSQYEEEELGSDFSSDESQVDDPTYYEEASWEDNDESGNSSQEEDNDSMCSSSCELDTNWEEESNDGSEYSYANKGMSYDFKFESEVPFQNYAN